MFRDTLKNRINVYRLQDITGYDFTGSTEGEVTEVWGLTAVNARAMFEPEDTPFQRRADGIVDVGTHTFYTEADVDIVNADRVYRTDGELGVDYFVVRAVKYIRDATNRLHHKEVNCDHIDWVAPAYTTVFIPVPDGPNISVRQMWFTYLDASKIVSDIDMSDWLQTLSVTIIVPFDDPDATLTMADGSEELWASDVIDLTIPGNYHEETISKLYSADDTVMLTLDAADSTQGTGYIFAQVLMSP